MAESTGSLRRTETEEGDEYFVDESNGAYQLVDGEHKRVGKWNDTYKFVQKEVIVTDPPPINRTVPSYGAPRRRTSHAFEVKDDDHCETPQEAYDDIGPILHQLAAKLGKTPETLQIYDPYYCAGAVVKNLGKIGFTQVYNKNEDFYEVVEQNRMPLYDVIVTNPPYSDDHIPRILSICAQSGKPWLILVPNYVYTKPYYVSSLLDPGGLPVHPFYLAPPGRYYYWSPEGHRGNEVSVKTAPFMSFWYLHLAEHTGSLIKWWNKSGRSESGSGAILAHRAEKLPHNMMGSYDKNRKRVRKKQRKLRARKLRKLHEAQDIQHQKEAAEQDERQWIEFNTFC